MRTWYCPRCDWTGEAPDDSRIHFHRCRPKRAARSWTIDQLMAAHGDVDEWEESIRKRRFADLMEKFG